MKFIIPEAYIKDGWVTKRKHPDLSLWIYNYTPKTQFDKHWDEITTQCRGLILDINNNVVAIPFKKFFNYGELPQETLPKLPFTVTEKIDGSLIIICRYEKNIIISTRGSFTSQQAQRAKEIWYNKYSNLESNILENYTYLFELVDPENKIIVDYGDTSDLIALEYTNNDLLQYNYLTHPFNFTKQYTHFDNIEQVNNFEPHWENREGYVIKFSNGYRIKVKSMEYFRLHKIISNLSEKTIWESLKNNDALDLQNIPDEFYQWAHNVKNKFLDDYNKIEEYCKKAVIQISEKELPTRKEIAMEINNKYKYPSIIFLMIDKKDYSLNIWEKLKPKQEKV